jgi:hypothetical protein
LDSDSRKRAKNSDDNDDDLVVEMDMDMEMWLFEWTFWLIGTLMNDFPDPLPEIRATSLATAQQFMDNWYHIQYWRFYI